MQVTKDMIIADVLKLDPSTAKFFLDIGMHCLGCPSASGESIEEACAVHATDRTRLWQALTSIWRINKFW